MTLKLCYILLSPHDLIIVTAFLPAWARKHSNGYQNSAARLLTRSRKYDHITPVLASLHWLPVCFRIDFKILLITFKALHDLAPAYISELLVPYVPSRSLRSSGSRLLFLPVSRLITKGDRAFSIRAPKLWNELPEEIRLTESLTIFKSLLKTHLYRRAFPDFIWACLCFYSVFFLYMYFMLFVLICVFIVQHFVTVFWKVLYK